jgi:hypothetical protein
MRFRCARRPWQSVIELESQPESLQFAIASRRIELMTAMDNHGKSYKRELSLARSQLHIGLAVIVASTKLRPSEI